MIRSATFSEDRSKRWDLVRDWSTGLFGGTPYTLLLVMLNPSRAGEKDDDPTVRKGVGFGKRWGFSRMVACNLIATVSTDPSELPAFAGIDMENRAVLQRWMGEADMVVAAWGNQPKKVAEHIALAALIKIFLSTAPVPIHCIGTTKDGSPLHPSRAPYTDKPLLWDPNP